jgi:hypothetical protein
VSLIDEALKRARADAGRADAASQVTPVRWFPAPAAAARNARRRALLTGLLAGGLGIAVVVLALALAWSRSRAAPVGAPSASPQTAAPPPVRPEPVAAPVAAPPVVKPSSWERARQESVREEAARQAALRLTASESSASRVTETRSTPVHEPALPPVKAAAAVSPARPAPEVAALEDGKSYSRSVPLQEGGQITLSGIAYSETNPVAVLNGKVVSPGELVSGFTVSRIEIDRVELKGHGVAIVLLLN